MKPETRQKFIVGNWKMRTAPFEAKALAKGIPERIRLTNWVTVILCPPFPYLALVENILQGSGIELGAQNMYPQEKGQFTGELSPNMLLDVGCK